MTLVSLIVLIAVAVVVLGGLVGLVATTRRRRPTEPSRDQAVTETQEVPPADEAETLDGTPPAGVATGEAATGTLDLERPEPTASRLVRLRQRLSRSQGGLGRGLLALLSRDRIDEDTWEEIEDVLLTADVGVGPTQELVARLRTRLKVEGGHAAPVRDVLHEELVTLVDPSLDRRLAVRGADGRPGVVLVVGVNGTGKTTTVGKLGRILVAEGPLGADGCRGHLPRGRQRAADDVGRAGRRLRGHRSGGQRPGQRRVRGRAPWGRGVVRRRLVDTAGRLQNKAGLMDELGKVKRVVEKQTPVTEVLLVLDATTGQNGLTQARVFSEVVDVTGIVLTKLDGSAKGGIVVAVQRELCVPVKLVGLGEGPDDLAPFDPDAFVDALLG